MKGIFRNRKLFTFTCVFLAFMVSVISFFQYHNAMQVEARDIVKNIVIQSSLYVPRDEIVSERTENSKKYYLGNNSYALDISMAAIHYKDNYSDKQEQWKDIDLTFENGLITKAPYILSVDQDNKSFTVQDKKTGQTTTVRLTRIGNQDVQQIERKAGVISEGKIQWTDVATDLDLSITAENTKVSFDWIVKSENAPHEVQFEIEDGGIPIIYRGVDAEGKEVEISVSKSGNTMTETVQKGGKYPKIINPTLDLYVGASADDRMVGWMNGNWFIEGATIYAGRVGYVNWVLNKTGNGLRWTGITIPAGSTIDTAYLTVVSFSSIDTTTVNSRITGDKENNPSAWSSLADYKARRGTVVGGANNNYITTAQVSWDNIESFVSGNSYSSPEIKTVIQELIDAHAPSNEAMALFWDDHEGRSSTEEGAYRSIKTYDSGYAPELHIEYTEPPPEPPDNVQATDGSYTDKVHISWEASSGADDYNVYRNTTNDSGTASQIGTPTQSPFNDTSATPNITYYYWVKASCTNGDSDFSGCDTGMRVDHRSWGTKIKDSTDIDGVWRIRSLFKNYEVPSNDATLYAPTFIAPNNCPLEIASSYRYENGAKQKQIRIYDHTDQSKIVIEGNNVDPYLNGTNYYYAEIFYDWDSKWKAALYNFTEQQWQNKDDANPLSGEKARAYGWDIFEEYGFSETNWPALGYTFESYALKVYDGGWTNCTATYGENDTYTNMGSAPYSRSYTSNYYHWYVED